MAMNRLSSDFTVRLYGPSYGESSFARVTRGMEEGLKACDKFAGAVWLNDDPDDDWVSAASSICKGEQAPCAVYVGPPSGVGHMPRWHKERWALLAANSSWIPSNLLRSMWPHVTGFLAPSQWAADVLRGYVDKIGAELGPRAVSVWPHGVSSDLVPHPAMRLARLDEYREQGMFRVLHMASTRLERKGTAQLVEAWCTLLDEGRLGTRPQLHLVLDEPPRWPKHVQEMAARFVREIESLQPSGVRIRHRDPDAQIKVIDRQGVSSAIAAAMYGGQHLVCQPSRGEGFGLVPLEARACGVPVAMTLCTGHSEHAFASVRNGVVAPGVHTIVSHNLAPIDDGPGAMAPEVRAEDVATALRAAYETWPDLSERALRAAPDVAEHWSWLAVTERWLKEGHA